MTPRVPMTLTGVPETLLWPLHNRASEARREHPMLDDPKAVAIADALDYPYLAKFGPPDSSHVLRALRFDERILAFVESRANVFVVELGAGLETQFDRVDDGVLRWLAVDLPESIDVRERFLPTSERHRNFACSALDLRWMDEVPRDASVLVTAAGLLMYFEPDEARRLVAACAERFPRGAMLFDTIPRWFSRRTLAGYDRTRSYRTPPMPWGLDADELHEITAWHPNVASLTEVPFGRGRDLMFGRILPLALRIPWLREKRAALVQLEFGPGDAP